MTTSPGRVAAGAREVLGQAQQSGDAQPVRRPLRERAHHRAHGGGPGHVGLHRDLHVRGLERQAAGVERDALADQHHVPGVPRSGRLPSPAAPAAGGAPTPPRPRPGRRTPPGPAPPRRARGSSGRTPPRPPRACSAIHAGSLMFGGVWIRIRAASVAPACTLPCRDRPLADGDVADRQAHARGRRRWRRARPGRGRRAQEQALGERPDRRLLEPAAWPGPGPRRCPRTRRAAAAAERRTSEGVPEPRPSARTEAGVVTLQVDPDRLRSGPGGVRAAQPAREVDAPLREELDDRRVDPDGLVGTGRGLDADDDHARPRWRHPLTRRHRAGGRAPTSDRPPGDPPADRAPPRRASPAVRARKPPQNDANPATVPPGGSGCGVRDSVGALSQRPSSAGSRGHGPHRR